MNNDWVNDYLMHSGKKGQRWGVRLYQNPDGSLTPLGRLRYLKGGGNDAGRRRQERNDKWRSTKLDEVNRIYDKQDARAEKRYNKKMEKLSRNPGNEYKREKISIKYNTQKKIRDELREIETTKLSTMTPEEYYGKATARTIAAIALTSFVPYGAVFSVDVGLLDRPSEASFKEQREVASRHGKEGSAKIAEAKAKYKSTSKGDHYQNPDGSLTKTGKQRESEIMKRAREMTDSSSKWKENADFNGDGGERAYDEELMRNYKKAEAAYYEEQRKKRSK